MTKKQTEGIGILVIFAIIIGGIAKFFEAVGFIFPAIVVTLCLALYLYSKKQKAKQRYEYLIQKYRDEEIVTNIIDKTVWQGESEEQLIDSLGKPEAIDNKLLKTKKKEVYKYNHQGSNRYRLRITLENDVVVGWDQKA